MAGAKLSNDTHSGFGIVRQDDTGYHNNHANPNNSNNHYNNYYGDVDGDDNGNNKNHRNGYNNCCRNASLRWYLENWRLSFGHYPW